jgi:fructose-bisphosphate aldolase class I
MAAAVDAALAPSPFRDELRATAKAMVVAGKGLLACDEPPHVLPTRMKMCWTKPEETTEEWRIGYRELMFTTPGLSQYVSGIILHEETVEQQMSATKGAAKQTVPHMLKDLGIIPGVKVDRAFVKMMGSEETHTQGLDGLGERCKKYYALGCRFAKWRSPLHIGVGTPSETALRMECDGLARYASICQENGLMPIVEPDVVMDGDHSIVTSAEVTKRVLTQTFASLDRHNVDIEGIVIKTNMVRPGEKSGEPEDAALVGAATVKVFGTCFPATLPGIVFLSGGMSEEYATAALAAINADPERKRLPWPMTFSYGRALQHSARVNWLGKAENYEKGQKALLERARVNSEASYGRYVASGNGATNTSLHVAGGNKY